MTFDKKIEGLDNYIHNHIYSYPDSLLDEIELIRSFANEISKIASSRILIYSDHGFSFLCTKHFGANKKYNFEDSGHEGRYFLMNDKEFKDTEDYIVYNQKYLITLKHVSLYNTSPREVHGGATPEEFLVPSIVFEIDSNSIKYTISSEINEINISKEKELPIKIKPDPIVLPVAICNNELLPISKDNNRYLIKLNDNLKKGKHEIIFKINDEEVGALEINIKKGGMEEEEYDFG